ncbi:unnamed protein product, partial [Polarella glacialis]
FTVAAFGARKAGRLLGDPGAAQRQRRGERAAALGVSGSTPAAGDEVLDEEADANSTSQDFPDEEAESAVALRAEEQRLPNENEREAAAGENSGAGQGSHESSTAAGKGGAQGCSLALADAGWSSSSCFVLGSPLTDSKCFVSRRAPGRRRVRCTCLVNWL